MSGAEGGLRRPVLIVTRPAEETARTVAAVEQAGFEALVAPLLTIEPLPWNPPPVLPPAILFTSGRSPALVAAGWPRACAVPAYVVGARTAELAVASGFRVAGVGTGDGSAALALAARDGVRSIWHAGGEATAPADMPAGLIVHRTPIYAAREAAGLPTGVIELLVGGKAAVLLFSARTARRFAMLYDAAGLDRDRSSLVALSPAVAAAAGQAWHRVAVAGVPSLEGALAAARSLWQGTDHG